MALRQALAAELEELATHYPERRAALIPALHRCQEENAGWLSPQVIEDLAAFFGLEPVEVFGVASFYPMFHLRPVGRHVVSVCHNISCDLRGADEILAQVCRIARVPLDAPHGAPDTGSHAGANGGPAGHGGSGDAHGDVRHGGATSADGRFTVKTVECQGACANAPMLDLDGEYFEDLDERKVEEILERLA